MLANASTRKSPWLVHVILESRATGYRCRYTRARGIRLASDWAEAPVKFVICVLMLATSVATADCLFPPPLSPVEVDILTGQTIAMLKSSGFSTLCVCDERYLNLILNEIIYRQPYTRLRTYFVLGQGYCADLKAGWATGPSRSSRARWLEFQDNLD